MHHILKSPALGKGRQLMDIFRSMMLNKCLVFIAQPETREGYYICYYNLATMHEGLTLDFLHMISTHVCTGAPNHTILIKQ